MNVKFKGNQVTLEGNIVKVGDVAPDFVVIDNGLNSVATKDFKGKRVYVSVPSIDTQVCDVEVRKFNQEATKLQDVKIYTISMDLPFAQARWCGNAGIEAVQTLSDYKDRSFGKEFGTYIKELGLLTRAVFVVDENNKITYVEYCEEVTSEPNYEAVLNALK
jgi:thiol peroxidase